MRKALEKGEKGKTATENCWGVPGKGARRKEAFLRERLPRKDQMILYPCKTIVTQRHFLRVGVANYCGGQLRIFKSATVAW